MEEDKIKIGYLAGEKEEKTSLKNK